MQGFVAYRLGEFQLSKGKNRTTITTSLSSYQYYCLGFLTMDILNISRN